MIGSIASAYRKFVDPASQGNKRSSRWSAVRAEFMKGKTCAACGRKDKLNAHHVKPFHLFPGLELDPMNLIALCEGKTACHFTLGHGGDWKAFNPNVRQDAAHQLAMIQSRRYAA